MLTPDKTDLARLEAALNSLPKAMVGVLERYSRETRNDWKQMVHEVDAKDTWNYLNSIDVRADAGMSSGETKAFVIDTSSDRSVFYSDIVERGRTDTDKYPARFPAGKTLERQFENDTVEKITTITLDQFLHG